MTKTTLKTVNGINVGFFDSVKSVSESKRQSIEDMRQSACSSKKTQVFFNGKRVIARIKYGNQYVKHNGNVNIVFATDIEHADFVANKDALLDSLKDAISEGIVDSELKAINDALCQQRQKQYANA